MKKLILIFVAFMLCGFTIKAQVDLLNGLVGYYPFNGNANDESGSGNNGTVSGATLSTDRFGNVDKAYSFNGISNYIALNNKMINGAFTISVWCKPEAPSTLYGPLFCNGNNLNGSSGNGIYAYFAKTTANILCFEKAPFTTLGFYANTSSGVVFGNFNHYVFLWDGTTNANGAKLYINGVLISQGTSKSVLLNSTINMQLGYAKSGVNNMYYKGVIDDVRIYNRAINEQEIQSLYGATISTTNQSVILGNPIEVPIITSQLIASDNIISYQFNLDYDQTKLQYVDKSLVGTFAASGSAVVNTSSLGHLQISYMTSTPLSGAGNILKLNFNTLSTGNSPITISNFLYNTTPVTSITNSTVTINENIPPTTAITYSDADAKVKPNDVLTITATFSEPMSDNPVPQFVLSGANTLATASMTKVSNTVYTYNYTVANGNGTVNVSLASGTDLVGNLVVATPTSGATFSIDNVAPTVTLTYSDADLNVRVGDVLTTTATFSEPILDVPIAKFSLSGSNTLSATTMTKVSSTVYTYNHTVAKGSGNVNVSISNATDIVGNAVISPTTNNVFQIIPLQYGDVDDNGLVQAYDAALTLQYSVTLDPLPIIDPLPWETWRILTANVDNVAGITANDASLILQYSAGIITTFPVGTKKSNTEINVTAENGFVIFRTTGDLFGLNVSVPKDFSNLGQPQILNTDMISAFNIKQNIYAIGLATAYKPANGTPFMKIPIIGSVNSKITFDMIVNTENKSVTIDLATGVNEITENSLSMFPNPVTNELTINNISKNAIISIYDLNGKLLINKTAKSTIEKIDVSSLANGVYSIKVSDNNTTKTSKLIKQ